MALRALVLVVPEEKGKDGEGEVIVVAIGAIEESEQGYA
jgi:hypothetical protein